LFIENIFLNIAILFKYYILEKITMDAINLTSRCIELCREIEELKAKHLKIVTDLKKQNKELLEQSKIFNLGDRSDYKKTQK
jgi:hypothetical protein